MVVMVGATVVQSKESEPELGDEGISPLGDGAAGMVSQTNGGEGIPAVEWPHAVY